jgi:hypothetical protein
MEGGKQGGIKRQRGRKKDREREDFQQSIHCSVMGMFDSIIYCRVNPADSSNQTAKADGSAQKTCTLLLLLSATRILCLPSTATPHGPDSWPGPAP